MNSERKVVLVKIEATPGAEATPLPATDALQAIDFKWGNAGKATTDKFEYAAPYYGSRDVFAVSMQRDCSFDIPVIGAGMPLGTNYPASLLALYRAAGHAAIETADTDVVISPVSSGEEAATLLAYEDGILRKLVFGRGTMKWAFMEDKVPRCTMAMMGLYSTPTDAAMATPTFPALQKPIGFGKGNTVITLGGTVLKCKSVNVDGGRSWAYRHLSSVEDIVPVNNLPIAELSFEMPLVAMKAIYTELESTLDQALSLVHGTTAGNRFTLAAPRAQLVDLTESKDRGRIFVTAKLELLPSAAGVPYTIKLT